MLFTLAPYLVAAIPVVCLTILAAAVWTSRRAPAEVNAYCDFVDQDVDARQAAAAAAAAARQPHLRPVA
jgi:hypothetical protein